jgi:hypothetical protein
MSNEHGEVSHVRDSELLEHLLHPGELLLPPLVELHLGAGVGGSLVQIPKQDGLVLLSLKR